MMAPHHDDGTVADLDAVADDRASLDAGVDFALKVDMGTAELRQSFSTS